MQGNRICQTAQLALILLNRPLYTRWRLCIIALIKAVANAGLYDTATRANVVRPMFP